MDDVLSPKAKEIIERSKSSSLTDRQLTTLRYMADHVQEVLLVLKQSQEVDATAADDMRDKLQTIADNIGAVADKDMDFPDFAQPVVDAVSSMQTELTKAIGKINLKPQVNPTITVDAPKVTVDSPRVDLSGVERVLKNDLPLSLKKALSALPKPEVRETDLSPIIEKLGEMTEWLESIDTGTRLKVQFPNTIAVTNPDGSTISGGGGGGGGNITTAAKGSTTAGSVTSTSAGTDRQPLDVTLRDTSGNPVAVGGGTQYVDGAARGTATGTISMIDDGTNIQSAKGDTDGTAQTNVTKLAGTTVDTNSGAKSAGTMRVVLATDQPSLTNALKVDGSATTQPVSGSVSVSNFPASQAVTGTFFQATQPISDAGGSLTVDAPVGTPAFVRLSDGTAAITTLPVSLASVPSHAVTNAGTFSVQATSLIPGVTATSLGKAEDAVHASGDTGVFMLTVRNDNAVTTPASTNGDYSQLSVDSQGTAFTRHSPANTAAVSTPVVAAIVSTTILAANPARRSAILYNNSTSDCYVKYGTTASSTSFTLYVPSFSTISILGSEYAGILTAIWITANGSMMVTETSI